MWSIQTPQTPVCTGPGTSIERIRDAGALGQAVLPSDRALLQLKPLRPFAQGELAALVPGGPYTDEMLYVRVAADARPEPGRPLFRVASHQQYLTHRCMSTEF